MTSRLPMLHWQAGRMLHPGEPVAIAGAPDPVRVALLSGAGHSNRATDLRDRGVR